MIKFANSIFEILLFLLKKSCMKKSFFACFKMIALAMVVLFSHGIALGQSLSDKAQISLLTASPGDELYSVFGHSALRVVDPEHNIDLVYNYGTFDFDTPNFYLQFIRGKLLYKLSVAPMQYFTPEYQMDGRAIYEQVLNLSQQQKQLMFNFLSSNQLPENAYYHYDFFYDNCATRIRDLVDVILVPQWPQQHDINDASIASIRSVLDYEFDYQPHLKPNRTLRDMLQPFLKNMPWSAFGIDLALGLPADKVADAWDYMYLPDEMLIAFSLAQHADGTPLVSEHRVILNKTVETSPASMVLPIHVFWFIFLMGLLSIYRSKWSWVFDRVFFSLLGITGITVFFLWFFTDHITTKVNLNILWALPTHLYFIWFASYGPMKPTVGFYFRVVAFLMLVLLVLWPWIPQAYHPAFFPMVLLAGIKSALYGFNLPLIRNHLKENNKVIPS